MNPTPTDPREEKPFVRCCDDIITDRETKLAKLAAEIAEKDQEINALRVTLAEEIAKRVNTPNLAFLNAEVARLQSEIKDWRAGAKVEADEADSLRAQLASLRAELEAARKERDERKADLKMFMEMHDTALAAKDAAEKENKELREREGQLVIKWEGQQDRANQLESKLATLCAAKEKRVAEGLPIISDALSELSLTLANTERRESADCRLAAYLKASRASELIAALTPAPTQEPPAGGVTISTEKKGGEAGMFIESPPMKGASDVRPEGRPADVPPEGRGELLPFNLSDALAGKPVVTRDRRRASKIQGTDRLLGGTVNGIYYNWYLDGKCTNGNPLHDLFMLPTEGSGA